MPDPLSRIRLAIALLALLVSGMGGAPAWAQSPKEKPLAGGKLPPARNATEEVFKALLSRPAPPPRDPSEGVKLTGEFKSPENFFDPAKPPADDAPIRELIAYWTKAAAKSLRRPTDVARERLLTAAEADPLILVGFLKVLPDRQEVADRIAKLYEAAEEHDRLDFTWRMWVRWWLRYHSNYFIDELAERAGKVKDVRGEIINEEEFIAWAKYDREHARPTLELLAAGGQPRTSVLALSLLYRYAVADHALAEVEDYRTRLIKIAEDQTAPEKARELAINGILENEWPGRDDWFVSLLADETLFNPSDHFSDFRPLQDYGNDDPDKWIPIMARLVESEERATRRNAGNWLVHLVAREPRRDAILPLVRWLSEPEWLELDNNRQRAEFIRQLAEVQVPEVVPGLIWMVAHDQSDRPWAATALTRYSDPRAVPALTQALAQSPEESERNPLIGALIASGGISDADQLRDVEAYAAVVTSEAGRQDLIRRRYGGNDPLPLSVAVGKYLSEQSAVSDTVAQAVLDRADALRRKDPKLAKALFEAASKWQVKPVDLEIVRRLGDGRIDTAMIVNALDRRERLQKNLGPAVGSLLGGGGVAAGVAAAVLADELQASNLLGSSDQVAKISLLVCARLVQMQVPVIQVRDLLRSGDPLLDFVAEQYLLADDRPEARTALWERYGGQAFVTGWREAELSEYASHRFDQFEAERRRDVLAGTGAPLEIYAYLAAHGDGGQVVRVYADRIVYTFYENESRYQQAVVAPEAFTKFQTQVAAMRLTETGPRLGPCENDCVDFEFIALSRDRGRRLFHRMSGLNSLGLEWTFRALKEGAKTRYRLEDVIPGSEVLIASDSQLVWDIWQEGSDLLVRVERNQTHAEEEQEAAEKQDAEDNGDGWGSPAFEALERLKEKRKRERAGWFYFRQGKTGDPAPRPARVISPDEADLALDYERFTEDDNNRLGTASAAGVLLLRAEGESGGLWRRADDGSLTRVGGANRYSEPAVSNDGRWVLALRANENEHRPDDFVRIDLKSGREYRLNLAPADYAEVLGYVPLLDRFVIHRKRSESDNAVGPSPPEFSLIDPATGTSKLVTGNFEPLAQITRRMLQPTGRPGEYWAALAEEKRNETQIGRYDVKDFSFHPILTVPHLKFDSMRMWVDEANGKVYVVYQGQLIRLPLPVTSGTALAK